jgi:tryptophan 7-halogenase
LESTGLYLICKQLELFVQHYQARNIDQYNTIVAKYYDDIKNFIVFHYYSSKKRQTPFWEYYTNDENFSESFHRITSILKKHLPDQAFDIDLRFPKELPGKYAYTRICI